MGIGEGTTLACRRALGWLKDRLAPLVGLLGALVVIFAVGWLYLKYPGFFESLKAYGYIGVFVISLVLNATVIVPVSAVAVISSLGGALPLPYLVGMAGGIGAAVGEMTGYVAGRSGRDLLAKNKMYNRLEVWVRRWGFVAVMVLSIVPFLFDVVGIIAGAMRMPLWRFFLATWIGRTILYVMVAYLGAWGFNVIARWFS